MIYLFGIDVIEERCVCERGILRPEKINENSDVVVRMTVR